ncbi:hypothetical protein L7F22_007714 [Adiantum nelumboides]|nr:hypothetical protein [Adiantum nelumboides]
MQEVVGLMKNLSVHMMGDGRGQGYGYGCGYGSNECFAGGRGRGMAGRGDMFQCYNCGEWCHKSPQCDKPKRMGGDMFPLPSQIPSRAQDYGIEIRGEAGPSGLTAEEKGKTKVVNIILLDKGKDDINAMVMPVGKRTTRKQETSDVGPSHKRGKQAGTARGKCYILTVVDYLSRWAEAKPVKQITSKDVAKFVYEDICCKFGMHLELLSDKGPGFQGELVDYLCEKLHVRRRFTTPYYPQCNGMNERFNGELIRMLTNMMQSNVKTWDLELPCALWAYRTAIKTGTGFSPFHLVFGKEALLPIEVEIPALKMMLKFEEENHDALKERLLYLQCLQLDRALALEHYEQVLKTSQAKANAKVKDKGIKKGDMVLRYNSKLDSTFQKKFQIKWQSPFLVLAKWLKKYYARLMVIEDEPSFEESADMVVDCEEIMKTSSFTLQALFAATADHE